MRGESPARRALREAGLVPCFSGVPPQAHRAIRFWLAASKGFRPGELRSAAVRCFFFLFSVTTSALLAAIYMVDLMFTSRRLVISSGGFTVLLPLRPLAGVRRCVYRRICCRWQEFAIFLIFIFLKAVEASSLKTK